MPTGTGIGLRSKLLSGPMSPKITTGGGCHVGFGCVESPPHPLSRTNAKTAPAIKYERVMFRVPRLHPAPGASPCCEMVPFLLLKDRHGIQPVSTALHNRLRFLRAPALRRFKPRKKKPHASGCMGPVEHKVEWCAAALVRAKRLAWLSQVELAAQ